MNVVVFASDAKGLSSLNSTINELYKRNHNVFAIITQDTQLRHPRIHTDRFQFLTNVESDEKVYSKTLGIDLPFKPDWLIVNRERWNPETDIIVEFKKEFGAKVGLIEPNAAMINGVEGFMENHSKNRFVPFIDVFFDHSEFISSQRKVMGFEGNSVVVGNPKYDTNLNVSDEVIGNLKNLYGVDESKTQVLLFSLVNSSRGELLKHFQTFVKDNPQYQFFIKPYPGEPFEPQFRDQYHPQFFIEGVTPILDETHIWGMFNICDIHMGAFSSIFHPSFLLNKKVVDLSREIGMRDRVLSTNGILNSEGVGVEDKADLWMRTFNFGDMTELKEFISDKVISDISKNNDEVWNIVNNFVYLNNNRDYKEILSYFDDFNDMNACNRIVNYIETNEV